jgi:hypothetical protein
MFTVKTRNHRKGKAVHLFQIARADLTVRSVLPASSRTRLYRENIIGTPLPFLSLFQCSERTLHGENKNGT